MHLQPEIQDSLSSVRFGTAEHSFACDSAATRATLSTASKRACLFLSNTNGPCE